MTVHAHVQLILRRQQRLLQFGGSTRHPPAHTMPAFLAQAVPHDIHVLAHGSGAVLHKVLQSAKLLATSEILRPSPPSVGHPLKDADCRSPFDKTLALMGHSSKDPERARLR